MSAVCIADGMYPQTKYDQMHIAHKIHFFQLSQLMHFFHLSSHRLRKIVRKAMNICESVFKNENLMQTAVVPEIIAMLGPVYPELEKNAMNIRETLDFENEHYKSLRARNRKEFHALNIPSNSILSEDDTIDFAGFPTAYREVEKLLHANASIESLPIDFVYERLHVGLGLGDELIEKIAQEKQLKIDWDKFAEHKQHKKLEAKLARQRVDSSLLYSIENIAAPQTDSSFVYDYAFDAATGRFDVPKIQAKIELIQSSGDNVHHIVLDKTNFYHTAGGQDCDIGYMTDSNGTIFTVDAVEIHKGYVFHTGRFADAKSAFDKNQAVELHVDAAHRTGLSQHHTAMHLLQAAVKCVTGQITFQQSSHVSSNVMKCDLGAIGQRIDLNQLTEIEQLIRNIIQANVPIQTDFLTAPSLYALDNVTTIPGEVYPDENIRVLKITNENPCFKSIEPCCGTHVRRTGELQDFCITSFKFNTNNRSYNVNAVVGPSVSTIKQNELTVLEKFNKLKQQIKASADPGDCDWKILEKTANELARELNEIDVPYTTRAQIDTEMDELKKHIHLMQRAQLRATIISEMTGILVERIENNASFIVHILYTEEALEESLMADAEKVCHDLPVIILNVCNDKIIHGCASVPMKYATNQFNAKHWMEQFGKSLNIKCQPNKKKRQFARSMFLDIPDKLFTRDQLEQALQNAKIAAKNAFNKIVNADQQNRQNQESDLIERIDGVRRRLSHQENSLSKLVDMEAETKEIRGHIKNSLFLYMIKKKCMADVALLDEQIFDKRSSMEK